MNNNDKTNPLWGGRFKDKADEINILEKSFANQLKDLLIGNIYLSGSDKLINKKVIDQICILMIDRQDALNAMNPDILRELDQAIKIIDKVNYKFRWIYLINL